MVRLAIDQPVATSQPVVAVAPLLLPGWHRFSLTVIDATGLVSQPAEVIVEVRRAVIPPVPAPPPVAESARSTPVTPPPAGPTPARSRPVRPARSRRQTPIVGPPPAGPEE